MTFMVLWYFRMNIHTYTCLGYKCGVCSPVVCLSGFPNEHSRPIQGTHPFGIGKPTGKHPAAFSCWKKVPC